MKKIILLSFLVICSIGYTQNNCDCKKDLEFAVGYYQRNLPGFKDNVTSKTKDYYNDLKKKLFSASEKVTLKTDCFKILTQYVEFFKDNHSAIYMDFHNVNEKDSTEIANFLQSEIYTSRETFPLDENTVKQYPLDDIRGLYQTKDGSYTITVIPSKTPLRDYIGVIIDSKTKLWKRGQVKLEFKKKPNTNNFEAFVYMRNHSIHYRNRFTYKNGILGGNWFKTSLKKMVNYATDVDFSYNFKMLNDSTAYLKIPTFSGGSSAKIDSLYKVAFPKIRKTPNLIIDVRNNGGGSDSNADPLLEFIYTNKIKRDKIDLYVTADNIKMWEKWYKDVKRDTLNYNKNRVAWFKEQVDIQKKAKLNSFIPRSKGGKMTKVYKKPNVVKKVAILYNRNCASSCETLLFWTMQSKKTLLVGENSGGYVGYGEIGSVKTPCYHFELGCTMTRYKNQRKYEADGIPPQYYLTNEKDWVEQTLELLKN